MRPSPAQAPAKDAKAASPYPPDVEVVRQIPITQSKDLGPAIDWLMSGASKSGGLAELLDGMMARIVAAGVPAHRSTLHMGTLHPQLVGLGAVWARDRGVCDELRVDAHVRETEAYQKSPLKAAIDEGKAVRIRPQTDEARERFPMMKALAAEDFTDYIAVPLHDREELFNVVTISTRTPGGFSEENVAAFKAVLPAFALNLQIAALTRIAGNVMAAYLGERSGARVLSGEIYRGSGETIDAIVWFSDMRGFTALSDRLSGPDMVRLLNAYFERLVEAVHANGGEVLKFMGDGMLAIFPVTDARPAPEAAEAALTAARSALAAVDAMNGNDGDALEIETEWRPIGTGIALHHGSVFYGNTGARDRLDFTVTGPTVNLAARVEPLAKETDRRLLVTEAVAKLLDEPLEDLGAFPLRGVAEPVAVFAAD